jgi:hypothetical protein
LRASHSIDGVPHGKNQELGIDADWFAFMLGDG